MSEQMMSMLKEILQKVEKIEQALHLDSGTNNAQRIGEIPSGASKDIIECWEEAKILIETEINETLYKALIAPLEIYKVEGKTVIFATQSHMQKEMMETRYKNLVLTAINFDKCLVDNVKFFIK